MKKQYQNKDKMESPMEYIPEFEPAKTSGNIIVIPWSWIIGKSPTPSESKGQKKSDN